MQLAHRALRQFAFLLVAVALVSVVACGGTKVYNTDKTIVHDSGIYNISNVQKVSTRVEADLPGGETVNMKGKDKKAVNDLLDEHDEIVVSTVFDLDQQELVYQRVRVDSYRDYSKVMSNYESAGKKITKFMADKKKTQLKL